MMLLLFLFFVYYFVGFVDFSFSGGWWIKLRMLFSPLCILLLLAPMATLLSFTNLLGIRLASNCVREFSPFSTLDLCLNM